MKRGLYHMKEDKEVLRVKRRERPRERVKREAKRESKERGQERDCTQSHCRFFFKSSWPDSWKAHVGRGVLEDVLEHKSCTTRKVTCRATLVHTSYSSITLVHTPYSSITQLLAAAKTRLAQSSRAELLLLCSYSPACCCAPVAARLACRGCKMSTR
jgi:hypothetical protein